MSRTLRVLHLEDDPDFARLVQELLRKEGWQTHPVVVDNHKDFVAALGKSTFDVILGDFQLPSGSGLQALHVARQKAPSTPFVLVSGILSEEAAVETLKSGATDFVLKSSLSRLVPAVQRALRETEARRHAQDNLAKTQAELVHVSRIAGMAEVATSVLHNVGNVLNSVNVSVSLVSDELKNSRIASLARVAALMREHQGDISDFLANDPKGKQVPDFLYKLSDHLIREQTALLEEMEQIRKNVDHIKDIVALQQSYSKTFGTTETISASELLEDAIRMSAGSLLRHEVEIVREYGRTPPKLVVERHKALQILVNLIQNAKYACDESNKPDKRLTLRLTDSPGRVNIAIIDNGVGIAPENFGRIFNYGFTTRKDGHGFGLHSSAVVAREMGGALRAQSDGPGKGATFILELPLERNSNS
jgi:C4-dicarboxylate-specific signal transduction histidine kinase